MTGPRVIQFVLGDVSRDARVRKTGRALLTAGYDVIYVGLDPSGDRAAAEFRKFGTLDGAPHYVINRQRRLYDRFLKRIDRRNPLKREGDTLRNSLKRAVASRTPKFRDRLETLATVPSYASAYAAHKLGAFRGVENLRDRFQYAADRESQHILALAPDIIHAHDLSALANLAPYLNHDTVKLIYDSHELETGRNWGNAPVEVQEANTRLEQKWISRADRVITVSEGVGLAIERNYPKVKPVIIENAQPRTHIRTNSPLRERLNLPVGDQVILYLGGVTFGRGLELLFQAFEKLPRSIHLAFMGKVAPDYQPILDEHLTRLGDAKKRVHLLGVQEYQDVIHQAYQADLGFNALELCCESYENALPNKFFEYIFAEVPIISTPQRDVASLAKKYQLGQVIPDNDLSALVDGLKRMLLEKPHVFDQALRKQFIDAHCWESQEKKILQLYAELGFAAP